MFTICHLSSGTTYNVFPDDALMKGTIRSYDDDTLETMKTRITDIATSVAKGFECEADVKFIERYPAVINAAEPTSHVIRLAKENFGEKNFSTDDLPLSASEDFSYFLQ